MHFILSFLAFIFFSSTHTLAAEPLPLWEAGAGIIPIRAEEYRGSPGNKTYLYPIPALTIRGKKVEAENGLIRGHLYQFGKFTFDVSMSVGLGVPVPSDSPRAGMPELDPTFELGPMIRYYLWQSKSGNHFINLEMPYRAVYSTNFKYIDHVGYYSIPYINFLSRPTEATFGWSSEFSIGIQYGSRQFHDRFYGVNTEYVGPNRPYYRAKAGYSGTQLSWAISKRYKNFLFVPFIRYDYLSGAVYNDSPLYKNPHYFNIGAAMIWFFIQSDEKQRAPTMVK